MSLISGVDSLSLCRFASASMQLPECQEIVLLYHICNNILRIEALFYFKCHVLQKALVLDPNSCPALSFVKALIVAIENKIRLRLYWELDEGHGISMTMQLQVTSCRLIVNSMFNELSNCKTCETLWLYPQRCVWLGLSWRKKTLCAWYHQNNSLRTLHSSSSWDIYTTEVIKSIQI